MIRVVVALALALFAAPVAAGAQPPRMPRVAFITTTSPENSTSANAFRQRLGELGYVDGQNIVVEWRWGRGRTDRFTEFAAEVVRLPVDVIVAGNTPAGLAAQKATKTIPIVIATMVDPVRDGFVTTLAHPGGNITGMTLDTPELSAKRLQLLKEALPNVSRVGFLADTNVGGFEEAKQAVEVAARSLGVQLVVQEVTNPGELQGAFAGMRRQGAGAALVGAGTMVFANREQIASEALKHRLPSVCVQLEQAGAGCLMSYGAPIRDMFRRAADLVDKILKGAKPADLPVEQPTTFALVINLKTAKTLGLTIPPAVLARADEVIQ
jgi:putative ABC transport system substrate-binding protein